MIAQSRTVRALLSIAYLITSHLFVGEPESCLLASDLVGDDFAGLCAVIVPSWNIQRKAPRCPAAGDARPRGVPILRYGLSRAVESVAQLRTWPSAPSTATAPAVPSGTSLCRCIVLTGGIGRLGAAMPGF